MILDNQRTFPSVDAPSGRCRMTSFIGETT